MGGYATRKMDEHAIQCPRNDDGKDIRVSTVESSRTESYGTRMSDGVKT